MRAGKKYTTWARDSNVEYGGEDKHTGDKEPHVTGEEAHG